MARKRSQGKGAVYVSYGSNQDEGRFMSYVDGGVAPGGTFEHPGCTDRTPPSFTAPIEVDLEMYFAGSSLYWDGGVAFVTPKKGERATKATAYGITEEQLWEIVAQENDAPRDFEHPTLEEVKRAGSLVLPAAGTKPQYRRIVHLGEMDGDPMVTFTTPRRHRVVRRPSEPYLETVTRGLVKNHELTTADAVAYLGALPGIFDQYTDAELRQTVRFAVAPPEQPCYPQSD